MHVVTVHTRGTDEEQADKGVDKQGKAGQDKARLTQTGTPGSNE